MTLLLIYCVCSTIAPPHSYKAKKLFFFLPKSSHHLAILIKISLFKVCYSYPHIYNKDIARHQFNSQFLCVPKAFIHTCDSFVSNNNKTAANFANERAYY